MNIARSALIAKLEMNPPASPPVNAPTDSELLEPSGCFVSLHQQNDHALRGCIGRLEATLPLWQAVRQTAADVLNDPRFTATPVTLHDVLNLEIELTILSPLKPADSPMSFEPLTDGLYLTLAGRAGCFLPQVARQTGWDREQLLTRLCTEKMGLPADAWKHPAAKLFTFAVEVVGPEALTPTA